MYGKQRFLVNNLITSADMITLSSQETGRLSGVSTVAVGSAAWAVSGSYSGPSDLVYTVQIDDTSAGKEVGDATYSWKTSETTSGWEATGVSTSATPTLLNYGVYIAFTSGTGDDFEDGDYGNFWAYAAFGAGNLLDYDRNTYWQSTGDSDETITIDLGSAKAITTLVIADHNLTDSATVTLMGNTSDSWGTPAYSHALTVEDPIVEYLSQTYRYWRVRIQDSTNPDGYLRVAELYLGTYTELAADFARLQWGSSINYKRNLVANEAETGRRTQRIWSVQRVFDMGYDPIDNTDTDTLKTVYDSTFDIATGRVTPLFIHYFQDDNETMMLCRFIGDFNVEYWKYGLNKITLKVEEVALTR